MLVQTIVYARMDASLSSDAFWRVSEDNEASTIRKLDLIEVAATGRAKGPWGWGALNVEVVGDRSLLQVEIDKS